MTTQPKKLIDDKQKDEYTRAYNGYPGDNGVCLQHCK